MQVYRDLRIITARPTPDEERRAPHRLYGHVDAAENYSVGRWCDEAAAALAASARQRNRRGDHRRRHRALLQCAHAAGLPPCRRSRPKFATRCARGLQSEGVAALHAELDRARSGGGGAADARRPRAHHPRAGSRCWRPAVRSWTGMRRTSRRASIRRARQKSFSCPSATNSLRRIDARFDAMIAAGALEEVRALAARGLDPTLPAMKAHGVPWLIRHLNGEITLDGGDRARQARYPPIHQAAGDLVPQSVAGVRMGRAARGAGRDREAVAGAGAVTRPTNPHDAYS